MTGGPLEFGQLTLAFDPENEVNRMERSNTQAGTTQDGCEAAGLNALTQRGHITCGGCSAIWTAKTAARCSDSSGEFGFHEVSIARDDVGDEFGHSLSRTMVLRPQLQIFEPVIPLDTVTMVDGLFGIERTTEVLRHHKSVHVGVALSVGLRMIEAHPQSAVAIRRDNRHALAPLCAFVGTPPVHARRAPRAVSTIAGGSVTGRVLARYSWSPIRDAGLRAPALPVAARLERRRTGLADLGGRHLHHAVRLSGTFSAADPFHRDGMWRGPELTDDQKARLFGGKS